MIHAPALRRLDSLDALLPHRDDPAHRHELLLQRGDSSGGDAVGATTVLGLQRFDPAALLQAANRPIERAWFQMGAAEVLDIFHHGIAVLGTACQARENKYGRIGEASKVR